jgi:DNA-binding transcriptional LysR family regulator
MRGPPHDVKPLHFHLDQLVTFYLVATALSFTDAAEQLCLTQPAVSMQIRTLETRFGVKLVSMRKRVVCLTAAGEALVPHAEQVYRSALAAESLLRSHGGNSHLKIGVASALTLYLLPLVERFKDLNPDVHVTLKEGSSLKLLDELRESRHDVCLVADSNGAAADLTVRRLDAIAPLGLVVSPDNPLSSQDAVNWEDLAPYPLILRCEGSVSRNIVLDELATRGIAPTIAAELDSVEAVNWLVQHGGGVALVFLPSVAREITDHRLVVLPMVSGSVSVGIDLVVRPESVVPPACQAFISLAEEMVA